MKVRGLEYLPSLFTVRQGIPVAWMVDGSQAQDCARVLTVPDLGLSISLPAQGVKTIVFVPRSMGNLRFRCPMALTTAGAMFTVVPAHPAGVATPRTGPISMRTTVHSADHAPLAICWPHPSASSSVAEHFPVSDSRPLALRTCAHHVAARAAQVCALQPLVRLQPLVEAG